MPEHKPRRSADLLHAAASYRTQPLTKVAKVTPDGPDIAAPITGRFAGTMLAEESKPRGKTVDEVNFSNWQRQQSDNDKHDAAKYYLDRDMHDEALGSWSAWCRNEASP